MSMSFYATANRPAESHHSRYDDDDLDSEEEEEERRLSEQYGEAADSAMRKRGPRAQANAALTEEDAAAAREFEETVRPKKVQRPTLQTSDLKSAGGLLFVRRSFPSQVAKFRHASSSSLASSGIVRGSGVKSNELARKLNFTSQINAAARYSRSLLGSYRDFARELAPSLAVEDAFLKIEDMGSKKDVKDYLQLMRDDFRKEYLTRIYGKDKAERILNELEYGLRASQRPEEDDEYYGGKAGGGERSNVAPRLGFAVSEDGETPPSSPPSNVPAIANPYTRSLVEVNSSLQALGDNVDLPYHDDVEKDETGAILSMGYNNDINVAKAHIAADLPAGERGGTSTAAPTAEDGVGIECTLLEGNNNDNSVDEPKAQENDMDNDVDYQQFDLNKVHENTFVDVNLGHDDVDAENPSNLSEILPFDEKTQETLTMMESQMENYDEYSQDERFSQLSEKLNDEAPTHISSSEGGRFSQTQDDRFSQLDNTADERFSQFTQAIFDVRRD
jgi:hypothetical protein